MELLQELNRRQREEIDMDEYRRRQEKKLPPKPTATPQRKLKKGYPKSHTYHKSGFKEFHADQMKGREVDTHA